MRTGIALGSNMGDCLSKLREARDHLFSICDRGSSISSPVYKTEPVGCEPGTAAFLNAIVEVETDMHPSLLLDELQRIEALMGRPSKRPRNASRPIDLDILYAGNLVLNNEEIIIPHPRLHLRRFVLAPLNVIRPDLILPGQTLSISALFAQLNDPTLVETVSQTW